MQFKRILSLVLALSLSLVLAACGGASNTGGEATEAASGGETSETNETGGSSVELSESASATDPMGGTVTVSYPSGWTATPTEGTGTIAFAGTEPGQAAAVTFINSTMASALGDSPAAILNSQTSAFTGVPGAEVSEVAESELGGNPAASISITVAGVATYYYVVSVDGGYAFVYGSVDQATVEAIAASVSYAGA